MSKELIISVNGGEKKIAILDNGRVTEFYIERGDENAGIAGNIYKGRVQRVLPGMQSAFVSIGLERDAFLYVSDFFDEEEEIERIVMEKSKKSTPEEAKREAIDQIDRARIDREKQMEAVQEIAEPLEEGRAEAIEDEAEESEPQQQPEGERKGRNRGRGRGRGGRDARLSHEQKEQAAPVFEMDDSGFERIIDDEDTGDMFKDAYMQEAIIDQVRAIEFDMEGVAAAEVGSLIGAVAEAQSGFERIADEDEEPAPEPRGKKSAAKSRGGKGAKKPASKKPTVEAKPVGTQETEVPVKEKKAKSSAKPAKGKTSRGKSKTEAGQLEDAEASLKESGDSAEMTVRRGGRGRRRGGRGRKPEGEGIEENTDSGETGEDGIDETQPENLEMEAAETEAPAPVEARRSRRNEEVKKVKEVEETLDTDENSEEQKDTRNTREPREGRDNRGGRDNRNRDNRDNRENRDTREKPAQGERGPRNDRNDRLERGPSNNRSDRNDRSQRTPQPTISDLLREGQEILVQIAKEPIAKKGARITSHIALPGRYLVYMPTIEHLGVSRKIESASERSRLRTLIQRIKQEVELPSGGFIVRTAGVGISEEDLKNDAIYLVRTWLDIKKTTEKAKSPALVHQDLDIVQRILRDQMSDEFTAIRVDSEEEYLRTVEFVNRIQPKMVNRVKLYTRDEPILDAYGVQEEIDKALKPRVWLKSGGYLVINQTEALVAIDVNTGKFVGKGNARLEDTITRTNMEAVDEIARQIRLRDLGGIIVLDLIDMEDRRNRHKVSQALQDALASDKSPNKVLSFNDFGLIIMTRKRVKQSLERTMCAPCDYCEGAGWVKSPQTVCYEILTEARRLSRHLDDVRQTTLRVHPDVAKAIRTTEKEVFDEIEHLVGTVDVTADKSIHQEQFDFAFI
ncbi:MAG: Rne/Rng family ribonuclease [Pyrinomonadaceae bacterium]